MAKFKKSRRKKRKAIRLKMRTDTSYSVVAVFLMLLGILVFISFTGKGQLLVFINDLLTANFGVAMLFLPFVFFAAGLVMLRSKHAWSKPTILLGTILLMLGTMGLAQSGEIGQSLFINFAKLFTAPGSYAFFVAVLLAGFLILSQSSLLELAAGLAKPFKRKNKEPKSAKDIFADQVTEKEIKKAKGFFIPSFGLGKKANLQKGASFNNEIEQDNTSAKAIIEDEIKKQTGAATSLDNQEALNAASAPMVWEYPPLSLLSQKSGGKADRGDVKGNATIIENTLDSFGIQAKVVEYNPGPAVTQYALDITKGTRLSKITALSTDLALALSAPTGQIRIEAPIPGRNLVGVEVPNRSAEYVTLKTMLSAPAMKKHKSKLAVALGIDVSGNPSIVDISSMPHLLIAGSTGSGKSVCINSFICSILFRATPEEVKFILVDPKRVELTGYNDIPHLLTQVIVAHNKVVSALKWAYQMMDKRYKMLQEVGVKNINDYNELAGLATMPNIVIVIDELADVMLFAPSEVEESVTRIAQMARAIGIHLVLATQRPSVDILTGLIKANIPTRIAFNVTSMTDSRVILDTPGAEKLLGRGDMLFQAPDKPKPIRVQGTFVSAEETNNLTQFLKSQGQKPHYEEEIVTKYQSSKVTGGSLGTDGSSSEIDDRCMEAARLFLTADKASSSLIQRRLSVGYARAARILDQLYEMGLVGPPDGSKPRDVNNNKIREFLMSKEQQG
ncbi:MAG TPA: DNA translocase FtsK [Candidatus Woesebacteria bacterium]|nr:DNA translocase FtsK [Candidatus Woesebacteria bacterium]